MGGIQDRINVPLPIHSIAKPGAITLYQMTARQSSKLINRIVDTQILKSVR